MVLAAEELESLPCHRLIALCAGARNVSWSCSWLPRRWHFTSRAASGHAPAQAFNTASEGSLLAHHPEP